MAIGSMNLNGLGLLKQLKIVFYAKRKDAVDHQQSGNLILKLRTEEGRNMPRKTISHRIDEGEQFDKKLLFLFFIKPCSIGPMKISVRSDIKGIKHSLRFNLDLYCRMIF